MTTTSIRQDRHSHTMCTMNYVPAACRERCTTRLVNILVILKFSFKKLRAFKYHPKTHKFVREIDEIVPCIIILHRFRCLPCLIRPSNGSFLCFERVITIGGRFRSILGGSRPSTMAHAVTLGSFLFLHEAPF